MCFHASPQTALWAVCRLMPYRRAAWGTVSPLRHTSRSSRTTATDRSPGPLPFTIISRELSRGVPRNRWAGLQHGGLSQWWQTNNASGIGPCSRDHAARCARSRRTRRSCHIMNLPYPPGRVTVRVQGQHSSGPRRSTRDQNPATCFAERGNPHTIGDVIRGILSGGHAQGGVCAPALSTLLSEIGPDYTIDRRVYASLDEVHTRPPVSHPHAHGRARTVVLIDRPARPLIHCRKLHH